MIRLPGLRVKRKPLKGRRWHYSSAQSNIVSAGINQPNVLALQIGVLMTDLPSDDWSEEFFRVAKKMAHASDEEREAWLTETKAALANHENCEAIIGHLRDYMTATRIAGTARATYAHLGEKIEADGFHKLEGLLDGSLQLPNNESERMRVFAYLALLGHLLPNLKQRFAQDDAQDFVTSYVKEILKREDTA